MHFRVKARRTRGEVDHRAIQVVVREREHPNVFVEGATPRDDAVEFHGHYGFLATIRKCPARAALAGSFDNSVSRRSKRSIAFGNSSSFLFTRTGMIVLPETPITSNPLRSNIFDKLIGVNVVSSNRS